MIIMSAEVAAPAPSALNMNSTAAVCMTLRRPQTSASRPAMNAPTAQPGSNALTVTPNHPGLSPNVLRSPSWVPLMTPLS